MKQATERAVSDSFFSFNQKPSPFLCQLGNGCFYIKAPEKDITSKVGPGALATPVFSTPSSEGGDHHPSAALLSTLYASDPSELNMPHYQTLDSHPPRENQARAELLTANASQ